MLHHPRHCSALLTLTRERLPDINFLDLANCAALHREYDALAAAIGRHVESLYLGDLLKGDRRAPAPVQHQSDHAHDELSGEEE